MVTRLLKYATNCYDLSSFPDGKTKRTLPKVKAGKKVSNKRALDRSGTPWERPYSSEPSKDNSSSKKAKKAIS